MNVFLRTARKAVVVAVLGIFASCSNGFDDMIEDYNSLFESPVSVTKSDAVILGPGEPGFEENSMLALNYSFDYREKLYLAGPPRAATYVWIIQPILTENEEGYIGRDVETRKYEIANSRYYTMTMLSCSIFERGKSYKLSLTVTDSTGKEYSDVAVLTITALY